MRNNASTLSKHFTFSGNQTITHTVGNFRDYVRTDNAYALRAELNQISSRKDHILYVSELTATEKSDDWKF